LKSNQELQDFAYVSSHDLQEPLRKINSFSDLLIKDYEKELPEKAQMYLQVIQRASIRMSRLISDLLTYSRVSTKAQPFSDVNLNEIIKEVLSDLDLIIQRRNAVVTVNDLCQLQGDPLQFHLLLQNLISNALKYVPEGKNPEIKVWSEKTKTTCTIFIKDNGIGFDEKYLDRIFTMFQRLHGKQEYEGTGIGLAVCKKIVERHNGTITARSKPGKGATFIVKLPSNILLVQSK
jgi:two-component system, NtrC family, sensor kinase